MKILLGMLLAVHPLLAQTNDTTLADSGGGQHEPFAGTNLASGAADQ